jgi:hypothetical protein
MAEFSDDQEVEAVLESLNNLKGYRVQGQEPFLAHVASLERQVVALAAAPPGNEALREENARLRELYENAVQNRDRFGWTINHLLECEEALRTAQEEMAKAEPVLVAADRVREAYDAMTEGRDIGRLSEWTLASPSREEGR